MRAQIVKINPKTVVLKNTKGVFATIPKTKLDFEYKLGDLITMEKNGNEVYFLPANAPSLQSKVEDFWGDSGVVEEIREAEKKEYSEQAMTGALLSVLFEIIGFFCLFYLFGLSALGCIVFAFANLSRANPKNKGAVIAILVVSILVLIAEFNYAAANGL